MDIDLCKQIQCGAVSQQEAGMDVLLECSQAGLVGVKGCGHPECSPYEDAMRVRGICPPFRAVAAVPVPASSMPPTLPIMTATLPSITPRPAIPPPVAEYEEPWWCPINRWATQNRFAAVLTLAGVYVLVAGWRRRIG